jgi:molybdate transport system substrate-binding protein
VNTRELTNTVQASVLVSAVLLALVACGSSPASAQRVYVSAAASLTDVFAAMESAFEEATPGVDIVLNLAGSSTLRDQILEGAPVDVFASADRVNMVSLAKAGELAGEPEVFARNHLEIAVPTGNPAGVLGLADFADRDLLIGLCIAQAPCGALALRALDNAGVTAAIDTNEPNVRALLTKIEAGELDAGITYLTDIVAAEGAVDGISIPDEVNVETEYPIAVVAGAARPALARVFVDFVLSDEGQALLADHGFAIR